MFESRTVLYLLCSFIDAGGGAGILRLACGGWNEIAW